MSTKPQLKTFAFTVYVTGLVVWQPRDGGSGAFLGVRTHSHSDHHHVASLTYEPRGLSGFGDWRVAAPDPLVAGPSGKIFARRELVDEILWLEPEFEGTPQPLSVNAAGLLRLRDLDRRVTGVRQDALGPDLGGTRAISRLDVGAGTLGVHSHARGGPWQVRGPDNAPSPDEISEIAAILRLDLENLRSLTIHSNQRPALRFSGEGLYIASYTVEPVRDIVATEDDPFPHFEMAFDLATWEGNHEPDEYCRLEPTEAPPFTVGDRACPPSGGGG